MSISLKDLKKTEASSISPKLKRQNNKLLSAIIKVNDSNYIPKDVKVRAKISKKLFTAQFKADILPKLEKDEKIVSISLSKKMRQIG